MTIYRRTYDGWADINYFRNRPFSTIMTRQNLPNISNKRKVYKPQMRIYFSFSLPVKRATYYEIIRIICPNFQTNGYLNSNLPKRREIQNQ